jgi:hypothetical protein
MASALRSSSPPATLIRSQLKALLSSHPRLTFHGTNAWPPQPPGGVFDPHNPASSPPFGMGVFEGVEIFRTNGYGGAPDHLKLQVEYKSRVHTCVLQIDDTAVLEPMKVFLDQHKNLSLNALGALEIDL